MNRVSLRAARGATVSMLLSLAPSSPAAEILNVDTPAMYNDSLGTILDGTSVFLPANNVSGPVTDIPEPDLSPASSILGNWLANPPVLSANWSGPQPIPTSWPVNTEDAAIFSFGDDFTRFTNLVLSINVDNSTFIWIDGDYVTGFRVFPSTPGPVAVPIGDLEPGVHHLQILREDFGAVTSTPFLELVGDRQTVPEPAALALLGLATAGLMRPTRTRLVRMQ